MGTGLTPFFPPPEIGKRRYILSERKAKGRYFFPTFGKKEHNLGEKKKKGMPPYLPGNKKRPSQVYFLLPTMPIFGRKRKIIP